MRIGFDLDGVLCDYDDAVFHMINRLPREELRVAQIHYFSTRKPLLDTELLLHEGDEYHVITGRNQGLRELTLRWCARHLPGAASVQVVGGTPRYEFTEEEFTGLDPEFSLKGKRDKIVELGIDAYFEDEPRNVRRLREMLPGVAIIQYGGILESEHPSTRGA
jgi:hypothetical protein